MEDIYILSLNVLLYVITTILFKKKFGGKNLATIAMAFYTVSAFMSLVYFITPFFAISISNIGEEYKLTPAIWLYAFNTLLCLTLRKAYFPKSDRVINYDKKVLDMLQVLLVSVFIVIVIFQLPGAIQNFSRDDLSDLRGEMSDQASTVHVPFFVEILSRFFGGFTVLLLVLPAFNYFVLKRKRAIDMITLLLYFAAKLATIGGAISRAVILFILIEILILIICLREYIPKTMMKKMIKWSLPLFGFLFFFFMAISFSRFSAGYSGESEGIEVLGSTLRYGGEGQLNFNMLMYEKTRGCTWFYGSFPLYRRLLGLNYSGEFGTDGFANLAFIDRIHPYPNYIFYQAAGAWYLDMGKYLPIIILIIINLIINWKRKPTFNFWMLLVTMIWSLYVMAGVFWALYGSEPYNILFVCLIVLFILLTGRYLKLPQNKIVTNQYVK